MEKYFPHHILTGAATLSLDYAGFRDGRLKTAQGGLEVAAGGQISRSLFDAAARHLGLYAQQLPENVRLLPYRQLRFEAALDARGLRLKGSCPTSDGLAMLADGDHGLLGAEPGRLLPLTSIVETLAPPNAIRLAAALETAGLLRVLPVSLNGDEAAMATRKGENDTR